MDALKKHSLLVALFAVLMVLWLWWTVERQDDVIQPTTETKVLVASEDYALLQELLAVIPDIEEKSVITQAMQTAGLSAAEVAEGIADTCRVSVQPKQVEELLARLVGYGRVSGEDVAVVASAVRRGGLAGYVTVAQERFQLTRQEAIDLLCAAAYTTVHRTILQSDDATVKEALLALETDLDELTVFVSKACGKPIKKGHIFELVRTLQESRIDMQMVRHKKWEPSTFFDNLAQLLSTTPEGVRMYVCGGA